MHPIAVLLVFAVAGAAGAADPPTPVLLELFTSQGCSSCPPADKLLAELLAHPPAGVETVALSFHVDYWNKLGWKDPFSNAAATERQREYAAAFGAQGVYTPQLVVDGQAELVGSQRGKALAAIAAAARKPKPALTLTATRKGRAVAVAITVPAGAEGQALLALAEDGLTSNPTRGENRGAKLKHVGVVRSLATVREFATPNAAALTLRPPLELPAAADPAKCRVVAFVQAVDRRITHVAAIPLPPAP